ncbi:histidine kinase [Flavobacteriaceae bacterium S356]|uniref:Histidine kinase n=1 Tax=Asprobacillus argus TaxID=3076534 RepID=A0ABU3LDK2_9FLAO|nr:histidine kinase [Flavobacteriaceae bacterium S356]
MIATKQTLESTKGTVDENELFFFLFQIWFIGTLVYMVGSWLFYRWKEYQELKNEKLKAELVNLKNQVSPHFFFNTLNNLYGLIKKDSDKAQEFVLQLSELMRYAIYSGDTEQVLLKEEITYVQNFISLHQIRHYKNVDIRFEQEVENETVLLYPLLLIILVENAFKHGVEQLVDNAYVYCKLAANDQKLVFTVENNFDVSNLVATNGVGLVNLKQRLTLLYPESHILETEQAKNIFTARLELTL